MPCPCEPTTATGFSVTLTPPTGSCLVAGNYNAAVCFDATASCSPCTETISNVQVCDIFCDVQATFTSINITGSAAVYISREVTGDCNTSSAICTTPQVIQLNLFCVACPDFDCNAFQTAFNDDPCAFLSLTTTLSTDGNTITPSIDLDCDAVRLAG